jgi:phytoene dehydrogenase-like protein
VRLLCGCSCRRCRTHLAATQPGNSTPHTVGLRPLAEGYANRVLDRIARHASDLSHKIRGIDILTPDDLLARNPNAVNGDPYGGSAELDQSLLWRPLASSGRHATPIDRLWHIGASTNPGAGLAGASGHSVATTLIQQANRAG